MSETSEPWIPMTMRPTAVFRFCIQLLMIILKAVLLIWAACAPLVWILRDGLGPDSHDSVWALSVFKFAVAWGVPALALAVPLCGLVLVDRWLVAGNRTGRLLRVIQ
jgi:hypothetical protein